MTANGDGTENKEVELGEDVKEEPKVAPKDYVYDPTSPPEEPYMELEAIAQLHAASNISVESVEKSVGLSKEEAEERLQKYGRNLLTPPPRIPEWKRLLLQFTNTFLILLNTCGVLSIVSFVIAGDNTNLYLGIVLFVVVFLTGYAQFHEEGKAYKIIDSFSKMLASDCTVIRDGKEETVPTDTLVPGDLVKIKNGDRVPADLVLLICRGLKAECSSLTGESEPISCTDKPSPEGMSYFECKNVAFNSSLCFDGMAIGVVFRTGDHTGIGTIAKLASQTNQRESTLQREVRRFVQFVAVVSVTMATICFVISIFVQNAKSGNQIVKSKLITGVRRLLYPTTLLASFFSFP